MRLAQLYYFVEVCQSLSITKSAAILHVSQPSLSVAIKELEGELGLKLFQRVKQRLQLTPEGKYFYQELTPILLNLDHLTNEMKSSGGNRHIIKMGIPPMIGSVLFTKIFSKLREEHPSIVMEIIERGTFDMEKLILDETVDLSMLLEESCTTDEIVFKPMQTVPIHICFHPNHPLSKRKSIHVTELKDEPLIMFNNRFYIHKTVRKTFDDNGIKPNIILETTHLYTIKQFMQQNIASSFLFADCICPDDNLKSVSVEGIDDVTIGIAWKKNLRLSSDIDKFIQVIDSMTF